jgi:hypothetical protein
MAASAHGPIRVDEAQNSLVLAGRLDHVSLMQKPSTDPHPGDPRRSPATATAMSLRALSIPVIAKPAARNGLRRSQLPVARS